MYKAEILSKLINEVFYQDLNLEVLGVSKEELNENTEIFTYNGLNLDSIDALEVVASLKRNFGLDLREKDKTFYETHFKTIGTVADYILSAKG
jgi:acyl carrier protein